MKLLDHCTTDRQKEIVLAVNKEGGINAAARALGLDASTVSKCFSTIRKRAAMHDSSEHYDNPNNVPEPYYLSGVSTYHAADPSTGRPAFWSKTRLSRDQFEKMLDEQAALYYEATPKIKTPKFDKKDLEKDIIPFFNIGDAHLGMMAHHAETNGNFDIKIATAELMAAFSILFEECKAGERCVINDLGDFTHYENMAGKTEASGHDLDFDGRFPKMIKAYVPLMRFIIETALTKFKHVDVIINQGNHSRTNDIWMRELLVNIYSESDRVHILDNSNIFIPYRMGKTFVLVHHSDKCKPGKLAQVMATDYAEHWGESEFRYCYIGHIHHGMQLKEHPGVTVESFNCLANKDKYAHEGGWRSRQSITRVDLSRKYGEVGRRRLSIEEIRDKLEKGLVKAKRGYTKQPKINVYTV